MVNARRAAAILPAVFLLLAILPGAGQEIEADPPRRVLLLFETAETAQIDPAQHLLLYESLLLKLGRASERIVVIEYGDVFDPPDDRERDLAAESRRADAWVRVVVDGRWPELSLSARISDLRATAPPRELALHKPIRRGAVDLERHYWNEITGAVVDSLPGDGRRAARAVSRVPLTLEGLPGTRIRGLSEDSLLIGEEGRITVDALLPATLNFRATRLGYRPVARDLYLEPDAGVLELAQQPGARWALSFYLQMMNYPDFDASWYPVRDFCWVRLGLSTYLLGLVLNGDPEEDQGLLVSYSLSHLNFAAGIYLNAADRRFRYYAGLGAFARFITVHEVGLALEPIAPWGLQPILGVEISRHPSRRFYVEYAPFFYLPSQPVLFRLSCSGDKGTPILPMPSEDPRVFWDVFVFRFGLRWLL